MPSRLSPGVLTTTDSGGACKYLTGQNEFCVASAITLNDHWARSERRLRADAVFTNPDRDPGLHSWL